MKILIDLDVVTVALWDKNKEAVEFLEKVKRGEFESYTPYNLLETLMKWKNEPLKAKILGFYELYSKKIISASESLNKLEELKIGKEVVGELQKIGVKEEDATLIFIASIFGIDFLVTFNRKHLRSKRDEINKVLRKNGLNEVGILLPSEI